MSVCFLLGLCGHLFLIKVYLPRRRAADKALDGFRRLRCTHRYFACAPSGLWSAGGGGACCARVGLFIKLRGWNKICERKKMSESWSKKSLTSVLILHAHLHTEVSWKFSVFFQKSPRPIKITRHPLPGCHPAIRVLAFRCDRTGLVCRHW